METSVVWQRDLKVLNWQDYAGIVRSLTDSFNVIKCDSECS